MIDKRRMLKVKKLIYILILLMGLGMVSAILLPSYLSVITIDAPTEIVIPQGASMNYVADMLYEKGMIRSKLWFKYQAKNNEVDRSIKPGTYVFEIDNTLEDVFNLLIKGQNEAPIVLTIPEGWTLHQIAERAETLGFGPVEEFIAATREYYKEKNYDFETDQLFFEMEGYLYPDTYYFNKNQGVKDIVARLASTMEQQFSEDDLQRAKELGLTMHEVLTIASLIEREAYHDEEKAAISGVIYNRMKANMRLQIDATVIYAIGEGKEHINRVLYSHLEYDHPFNTYANLGLPPGPIAAPGKASIHAALYPESHDFLYYVLGENGHVFGKTYEEHLQNKAAYQKMINGS